MPKTYRLAEAELEIGRLKAINADLLAALEDIALRAQNEHDYRQGVYTDDEPLQEALQGIANQARAAIEKAHAG